MLVILNSGEAIIDDAFIDFLTIHRIWIVLGRCLF